MMTVAKFNVITWPCKILRGVSKSFRHLIKVDLGINDIIDPFTVDRMEFSRPYGVKFCILEFFCYRYILQDFSALKYWNLMKT